MLTPGSFSTALSALVPAARSLRSPLPMALAPRVWSRPEGVATIDTVASFLAESFAAPCCWGSCAADTLAPRTIGASHEATEMLQRMTFTFPLGASEPRHIPRRSREKVRTHCHDFATKIGTLCKQRATI